MNKSIWIVISVFVMASLACSITIPGAPSVGVGEEQTYNVSQPAPGGSQPAELLIKMGAGKLNLQSGSDVLVEGSVTTNIEGWKPSVSSNGNVVIVEQESEEFTNLPDESITNEWDLRLGDTPMALRVEAGAYEGTLDLSGVPLTSLSISDGASTSDVLFGQPNPQEMGMFSYKTGLSTVKLTGLANANFAEMTFNGGAGSYTLDFSGELQRDARVEIEGGASNTKIIVPAGTPSQVTFTGNANNINPQGSWDVDGDVYTSQGSGPTLYIEVDLGLGNIDLIQE